LIVSLPIGARGIAVCACQTELNSSCLCSIANGRFNNPTCPDHRRSIAYRGVHACNWVDALDISVVELLGHTHISFPKWTHHTHANLDVAYQEYPFTLHKRLLK